MAESSSDESSQSDSSEWSSEEEDNYCREPLRNKVEGCWWPGGWMAVKVLWEGPNSNVVLAYRPLGDKFSAVKISMTDNRDECREEGELGQKIETATVLKCHGMWGWKSSYGKHVCVRYPLIGPSTQNVLDGDYGLPWPVVRSWVKQVAVGLRHLHALGYVHLDLRPENVALAHPCGSLVEAMNHVRAAFDRKAFEAHVARYPRKKGAKEKAAKIWCKRWWKSVGAGLWGGQADVEDGLDIGESTPVLLIDLGNARLISELEPKVNAVAEHYRSPAMMQGKPLSPMDDWWCLGCTAAEWLSGEVLFDYMPVRAHQKKIEETCKREFWEPWIHEHVHKLEDHEVEEIIRMLEAFLEPDARERRKKIELWLTR